MYSPGRPARATATEVGLASIQCAGLHEGLKPGHRGETQLRLVFVLSIEVGFRLDLSASGPRAIQPWPLKTKALKIKLTKSTFLSSFGVNGG